MWFRPFYYLGCKAGMAHLIRDAVESADPSAGIACDLFSGSGAVACALAPHRPVTTVDVQEYSRVVCDAQLNPPAISQAQVAEWTAGLTTSPLAQTLRWCVEPMLSLEAESLARAEQGDTELLVGILEAPPLKWTQDDGVGQLISEARLLVRKRLESCHLWESTDSTVIRYFAGIYFSFAHAAALDCAIAQAAAESPQFRSALLASALSLASELVNTVGKQFAQPIRPREKSGAVKRNITAAVRRDRTACAVSAYRSWLSAYASLARNTAHVHTAVRGDYLSVLSERGSSFSVVYADPPYTRDHYSRFYHVLETMCLRDEPEISMVTRAGARIPSRGAYREERHQSPFCIRSEAPTAFLKLFRAVHDLGIPLILSYSPHESGDGTHPRVVSSTTVLDLARSVYRDVDLQMVSGSKHNKLNRSELQLAERTHAEMLLVCRP